MSITETEKQAESADELESKDSAESAPDLEVADRPAKQSRQISISLRGFVVGLIIAVLAVAVGVLTWLYVDASRELSAEARAASDRSRAETVAMDYAVNAAQMDYQDFEAWKLKLVNGTSPELKEKLSTAADSMQEILAPLQWKSSARPLAAKVRSDAGGIYVVDAFVSVLTKTMQAPDGLQSTATYSVTMDSNNNWQITDVGGIDAALGK
ncbi:hypothetical protein [Mycolicibacterium austroafricanum]|uniref:hypothetical protein n=1 Tax=Mycolicibacterium austroafricanum TaxID=39687 RepID=UPI001CA30657|nr:hypothetical protein [Mycolicibacterium austroafricanum]QZT58616.1 hypothetical protein JN084_08570 [Mycolicibacterium austroafricanum]